MSMLQQPAEASAPSAELENSAVPVSPGFLRSQRVVIVACALVCAIAAALIFGLYVYPFVIEPAILAASSADMQKDGKDDYTTEPTNMESSTGGK